MDSQGGGGFRALIARLKSAPPWVWISLILAAGVLVVSWLIYRNQATANANGTSSTSSSAGQGTVPLDGAGQPLWNTADTSGMMTGNVTDLANLLAYLQSTQTPNPPATATPPPPPSGTTTTPGGNNGAQYFTVQKYSAANWRNSTLAGIAGMYNTTVGKLQSLNPNITNPNLVYQGEQIRVK